MSQRNGLLGRLNMNLYLRRVIHPQGHNNYRVVLKHGGTDFENGSIGVQHGSGGNVFWAWGIGAVVPMRDVGAEGSGQDREDCMRQFRAAWDRSSADRARLVEFLKAKRCGDVHPVPSPTSTPVCHFFGQSGTKLKTL